MRQLCASQRCRLAFSGWVAGNVANARAQVITAAGEGSAAAIALNADLVADDVARALAAPEPASRIKTVLNFN